MTYETDRKLRKFLNDKINTLLEQAKTLENPKVEDVIADLKNGKNLCGFELIKEIEEIRRIGFLLSTTITTPASLEFSILDIRIKINCGVFDAKKKKWGIRPSIQLGTSKVTSSWWNIDEYPKLVYLIFENSSQIEKELLKLESDIEKELLKFKSDLEKQKKIDEISQTSTKTWIHSVLKDSGYLYYTKEDKIKITLSVRMKLGVQLDIPIYFRRFQKQMPDLLETIREYEQIVANRKIKVLISNLKAYEKWKTF